MVKENITIRIQRRISALEKELGELRIAARVIDHLKPDIEDQQPAKDTPFAYPMLRGTTIGEQIIEILEFCGPSPTGIIVEILDSERNTPIRRATVGVTLSRLKEAGRIEQVGTKWQIATKNEAPAVQPASASISGRGDTLPIERFSLKPKPEPRESGPTAGREAPPPGRKFVEL